MANKNARWGQKPTGLTIMIAADSSKAHELFGGKTLEQVGRDLDLADEDVSFGYSDISGGRTIKNLLIAHNGVKWQIPFSIGAKADEMSSLDGCLNWMFRTGFRAVIKDGEKVMNGDTPLLADGKDGRDLKPYMTFGKPNGLTIDREEAAFAEPVTVEDTIAQ